MVKSTALLTTWLRH